MGCPDNAADASDSLAARHLRRALLPPDMNCFVPACRETRFQVCNSTLYADCPAGIAATGHACPAWTLVHLPASPATPRPLCDSVVDTLADRSWWSACLRGHQSRRPPLRRGVAVIACTKDCEHSPSIFDVVRPRRVERHVAPDRSRCRNWAPDGRLRAPLLLG